jgi:diguanylate cyclase (GGDEF)-like protein
MPQIPAEQASNLHQYADWFKNSFLDSDYAVIRQAIPHQVDVVLLPGIAEVLSSLNQLLKELDVSRGDYSTELSDELIPCLKRVMLTVRRNEAAKVDMSKLETRNPEVLRMLEEHLKPFDDFLRQEWLQNIEPMKMPRLTDYLSIRQIRDTLQSRGQLQGHNEENSSKRRYDEKFGILQAPQQFFEDLPLYRRSCKLRGTGVVVAYIDIDDFKKVNEKLKTEAKVDQLVLPRFMETIEAHVYEHGHAYRYGGDEYVLMIPNIDSELGGVFLEKLRQKVGMVQYFDTGVQTTISIGFIYVEPDSFLTDWDALELANRAKAFAKSEGGKNCVVTYRGPYFDKGELYVFSPKSDGNLES